MGLTHVAENPWYFSMQFGLYAGTCFYRIFFVYQETQAIDINLCLVLVVFLQGLRFVCLCFLWMFEESPPGNSHICWKLIVGRWSSFSNGPFSGDMFIFKGVFVILWFYVFKCCFMWFFWLTLPMSKNGRMWMKMLPPSTSSGMTSWCFRCRIPSLRRPVVWWHGEKPGCRCVGEWMEISMNTRTEINRSQWWQVVGRWVLFGFHYRAFREGCHSLFPGRANVGSVDPCLVIRVGPHHCTQLKILQSFWEGNTLMTEIEGASHILDFHP